MKNKGEKGAYGLNRWDWNIGLVNCECLLNDEQQIHLHDANPPLDENKQVE